MAASAGSESMERWRKIDAAPPERARVLLRECCAADPWVERMLSRRPFGDRDKVLAAARDEWFRLLPDDWREAFTHHPRIGDRETMRARFPTTRTLSEREQAGISGASDDVLKALLDANADYYQRFGFIFIVCASGKSAEEMLALLRRRLINEPAAEL